MITRGSKNKGRSKVASTKRSEEFVCKMLVVVYLFRMAHGLTWFLLSAEQNGVSHPIPCALENTDTKTPL